MKEKTNKNIRQPIVTVCGHVDHGKTSILDKIRQSSVQEGEAGGITQRISFTLYPTPLLKKAFPLIENSEIKIGIPGFLFIDTPGHAAFTNLRKRGGGLADLAVLVIDINEGIKPQTAEVIQILKNNKTPFVIALNKIDNISAWNSNTDLGIKENIDSQKENVKQNFNEKYLTLVGSLQSHGFDSDLYYNIDDFTKKIALVPCSAKTGEGLQELISVLCGLCQRYLSGRLVTGKEAKGVILEIKKEKETNYIESILYDGELNKNDEIAIANLNPEEIPVITKIRVLEEILPLSNKFKPAKKTKAATGIRMQTTEKTGILPGMPFQVYQGNLEKIQESFKKQISESVNSMLDKQGVIAKADSLGSLEALLLILKQNNIPVVKAGIGKINKADMISARANLEINELDAVIIGFNTDMESEAKEIKSEKVKVILDDVIYKLIENLVEFRQNKIQEIEKKRLMALSPISKIKVLHKYVFRNTNPAIFGVKVELGKLSSGAELISPEGEKIGKIKNLQSENKSVKEASEGQELSISIPGINFERKMKDIEFLYTDISENQFKNFKENKDLLSGNEKTLLQEIAEIKRKKKVDWGV